MREFLLSLGILLGIVAPQGDPSLAMRLFRADQALYATVELRDSLGADARKLVQAGNILELVLTIEGPLPDQQTEFRHQIAYNPITQQYTVTVGETARIHQTTSETAALDIYGRFFALSLAAEDQLVFPARIQLRTALNNLSDPSFATAVLWNYKQPALDMSFDRLGDYSPPGVPK